MSIKLIALYNMIRVQYRSICCLLVLLGGLLLLTSRLNTQTKRQTIFPLQIRLEVGGLQNHNNPGGNITLLSHQQSLSFTLFSAMTENYAILYSDYIDKNSRYAAQFNYSYFLFYPGKHYSHHSTGLRIYSALTLLQNKIASNHPIVQPYVVNQVNPVSHWIAYLDADAFVAEPSIPLSLLVTIADSYINTVTNSATACDFIAQDQNNIVNSGVFLLRNTSWANEFVMSWLKEYHKAETVWGIDLWVYDQGALMNSILHYAADEREELYEDTCVGAAAHANKCYQQTLDKFGFPYGKRKFGHICLIPAVGVPYSFHLHNSFTRGEFIRHQKGFRDHRDNVAKLPHDVVWKHGVLNRNHNNVLELINGTFLAFQFKNSSTPYQKVLFVILDDKKRHFIPDWDTFHWLGGHSMEDVVLVSENLFYSMQNGYAIGSVSADNAQD